MKNQTKFIIASKESGCANCTNLENFLKYALNGEYDDEITKVTKESNSKAYETLIAQTGSMSVPVIVNTETGEHISGFDATAVVTFLKK